MKTRILISATLLLTALPSLANSYVICHQGDNGYPSTLLPSLNKIIESGKTEVTVGSEKKVVHFDSNKVSAPMIYADSSRNYNWYACVTVTE